MENKLKQQLEVLQHYGLIGGVDLDFSDGILKPHNQVVYTKMINEFKKNNRVLIEQATGTGKSYLAMKLIKDTVLAQNKRVLFVSPTKAIDSSFKKNCKKVLGIDGKDERISTCLYAGLKKELKNFDNYDLIIFDEVHRTGAKTWGENTKKLIENNPNANIFGITATLNRADGVNVAEVIGVDEPASKLSLPTAIKKGILPSPNYVLANIAFEEDVKYFGLNEKELREKRATVDSKEERAQIDKLLEDIAIAKECVAGSKQLPEIFAEQLNTDKLKNGKFIVFCPGGQDDEENEESKLLMEKMMEQAQDWFKLATPNAPKTCGVHSKYKDKDNKNTIKSFEEDKSDGVKLLFSVNMLNEGLHVDDIDGVIMLRNTSSEIIYLQQLGRALSVGHNPNPLILDLVANITTKDIGYANSLLKEIEQKDDSEGNDKFPELPGLDNENINFKLNIENLDTLEFIETLKQNISSFNNSFNFEKFYGYCKQFYDEFGHLRIPDEYKSENEDGKVVYKLGSQMQSVKKATKGKGRHKPLTDQQYALLSKLDEDWALNDDELSEKRFLHFCKEYYKKHGDLRVLARETVTITYKNGKTEEYKLGNKMNASRAGINKILKKDELDNKKDNGEAIYNTKDGLDNKDDEETPHYLLSKETVKALTELDPYWFMQDGALANERFVDMCAEYYGQHGNLRIPKRKTLKILKMNGEIEEYKLGEKMKYVKNVLQGKAKGTPLSDELIKKMDSMDINWKKSEDDFINERFLRHCIDFYNRYGHLRIPQYYPTSSEKVKKQAFVTLLYLNGKTEEYNLGSKMDNVRKAMQGEEGGKAPPPEIVEKLNEMDPYWINREVSIEDMQKEKAEKAKQQAEQGQAVVDAIKAQAEAKQNQEANDANNKNSKNPTSDGASGNGDFM